MESCKNMCSNLIKISDDKYIVRWQEDDQFGEVTMIWDTNLGKLIVDTEMLGIESFINIVKSLNN